MRMISKGIILIFVFTRSLEKLDFYFVREGADANVFD